MMFLALMPSDLTAFLELMQFNDPVPSSTFGLMLGQW